MQLDRVSNEGSHLRLERDVVSERIARGICVAERDGDGRRQRDVWRGGRRGEHRTDEKTLDTGISRHELRSISVLFGCE